MQKSKNFILQERKKERKKERKDRAVNNNLGNIWVAQLFFNKHFSCKFNDIVVYPIKQTNKLRVLQSIIKMKRWKGLYQNAV
jgi:hypothetical protein